MTIPDKFIATNQLFNMKAGESGYIVPWGMWIDTSGHAYLNENYTIEHSKGGTVSLKVTRVVEGYVIHLDTFNYGGRDYKWQKQSSPGYMSPSEVCYGKVVAFSMDEYNGFKKDPNVIRALLNESILNEEYEKAAEYQNILNQIL